MVCVIAPSTHVQALEIISNSSSNVGNRQVFTIQDFDPQPRANREGYTPPFPALYRTGIEGIYHREQETTMVWNFGDGSEPVERKDKLQAAHVYRKAGDYVVKVELFDEQGRVFETASKPISINALTPSLISSVIVRDADQPSLVSFTAAFVGRDLDWQYEPVEFEWDFGDGNTRSGTDLFEVTHNYSKTGSYTTSLKIVNAYGASRTSNRKIKVIAKGEDNEQTVRNTIDTDNLVPPDVIADKVNLTIIGNVRGRVTADARRIAMSTFFAPTKHGRCQFWMNFWDDSQLMHGSFIVDLGKLPKLGSGEQSINFSLRDKQRFDLHFFSDKRKKNYLFRKTQLQGGSVENGLGGAMHVFDEPVNLRMSGGEIKLSLKKGAYILGAIQATLQGRHPDDPDKFVTVMAKGDFALNLGSRGAIMDEITKGFACQEHSFVETKRYPAAGQQHLTTDRPGVRINFSEDLQPDSVNTNTFQLGYPNDKGEFVQAAGRFVNTDSMIKFVPSTALRKGVRYSMRLKVGETGVRSASGEFIIDEDGSGWSETKFWTELPFQNARGDQDDGSKGISCDVYQSVKNVPLIKGKPALMRIYAAWPKLDDVHVDAQYREFTADVVHSGSDKKLPFRFTRPDLMSGWSRQALRESEAAEFPFTPGSVGLVNLHVDTHHEGEEQKYYTGCRAKIWDKAPTITVDVFALKPETGNYAYDGFGKKDDEFKSLNRASFDELLKNYLDDARVITLQMYPFMDIQFSVKPYLDLPFGTSAVLQRLLKQTNDSQADVIALIVPHHMSGGNGYMFTNFTSGQGQMYVSLSDASIYRSRYLYIMVHELGHVFDLQHNPRVTIKKARTALLSFTHKFTHFYDAIDGIQMSEDGDVWWHKSSRLGNEMSKNLVPLTYPGTMDIEKTFILRNEYRSVQKLLDSYK